MEIIKVTMAFSFGSRVKLINSIDDTDWGIVVEIKVSINNSVMYNVSELGWRYAEELEEKLI